MANVPKSLRGAVVFLAGVAAMAASAPAQSGCSDMLNGAPANVRGLDAVRACSGEQAACAYMESLPGHGVLTLICPLAVTHVHGANRLRSMTLRDGALTGTCSAGSWGHDFGLPGCYLRQRN